MAHTRSSILCVVTCALLAAPAEAQFNTGEIGGVVRDSSGSVRVEVRWEVFNSLNRANFDLPNRIFGRPGFGRIFSAKNPREMQFGLRFASQCVLQVAVTSSLGRSAAAGSLG